MLFRAVLVEVQVLVLGSGAISGSGSGSAKGSGTAEQQIPAGPCEVLIAPHGPARALNTRAT